MATNLRYFNEVKKQYAEARPNSLKLHKEACRYLPGGDTRTYTLSLHDALPISSFLIKVLLGIVLLPNSFAGPTL